MTVSCLQYRLSSIKLYIDLAGDITATHINANDLELDLRTCNVFHFVPVDTRSVERSFVGTSIRKLQSASNSRCPDIKRRTLVDPLLPSSTAIKVYLISVCWIASNVSCFKPQLPVIRATKILQLVLLHCCKTSWIAMLGVVERATSLFNCTVFCCPFYRTLGPNLRLNFCRFTSSRLHGGAGAGGGYNHMVWNRKQSTQQLTEAKKSYWRLHKLKGNKHPLEKKVEFFVRYTKLR